MGTSLTGLTPSTTYDALIKIGDNSNLTASLKTLSDGLGNDLPMQVSTTGVNFTGTVGGIPSTPPSGVAGAIQFSNGSAFASDATNLFWDNTNKRLGLGTNAPNEQLQVVGKIGASTLQIDSQNTLDRGNGLRYNYVGGSHILRFFTNSGTERLTILNDGSTGIGTDTPIARTHIKGSGSTSATTSLLVQNSAGTQALKIADDGRVDFSTFTVFNANMTTLGFLITQGVLTGTSYYIEQSGSTCLGAGSAAVASAILDIRSTTRGFLPPRMTTTQINAIASPAAGLVVYDSTTNKLCCYNGSTWNDLF